MDSESSKRVGKSSSSSLRSVPKSSSSRRDPTKKKPRPRKETESEKVFSLQDPGILDQREEKGKVYYLLNWADDPETGEQYKVGVLSPSFCSSTKRVANSLVAHLGTLRQRSSRRRRRLAEQEIPS